MIGGLIHQAQLPNKLGNYIFKLCLATAANLGIASSLPLLAMTEEGVSLRAPRGNPGGVWDCFGTDVPRNDENSKGKMTGFCSCLIHQAQLPNKLGNYIF